MAILTHCPNCKRLTKVPQDSAGKTVRCGGCKASFAVPAGTGELMVEWGPSGSGRRVPLQPARTVTIGRAQENTVSLPGPLVSRRHATLVWSDLEWKLKDAGSTNGTFVNGQRIKEIGLTDGSRIVIGDYALRLSVTTGGPGDLEKALDAMAVEASESNILAVVEGAAGPADSREETAMGHAALDAPEEQPVTVRPQERRLSQRWGMFAALGALIVIVVVLLVWLTV